MHMFCNATAPTGHGIVCFTLNAADKDTASALASIENAWSTLLRYGEVLPGHGTGKTSL